MNNIRRIADQFLIDQVYMDKLPLSLENIFQIAKHNEWDIYYYSQAHTIFQTLKDINIDIEPITHNKNAFTIISNDILPTIFINDNITLNEKIFALCHEIGHIVLQHSCHDGLLGNSDNNVTNTLQEKEADIFAYELIAPIPFLKQLKIKSYKDIKNVTWLDSTMSKNQFLEYLDEKDSSSYLVSNETEVEFCNKFKNSFKKYKHHSKKFHIKKLAIIAISILLCLAFIIGVSIFMINRIHNLDSNNINLPTSEISDEIIITEEITNTTSQEKPIISTTPDSEINEPNSFPQTDYDTNKNKIVYITKSGTKYHNQNCHFVSNKDNLSKITLGKAEQLGYEPCSFCQPKNN